MSLVEIPLPLLAVLGVSAVASLSMSFVVWRRDDSLLLKVTTTVIAFLPVLGPLFALWIVCFPDRMHPALRAKYPKMVNRYSVPNELLPDQSSPWSASKAPRKRRRSVRRRSGGASQHLVPRKD